MGIEDGLLIGFIGGLLIDMLVPGRPLGATTLALLLTLGIAFLVARTVGPGRKAMAVGLVIVLTAVLHVLFAIIMVPTAEVPFEIDLAAILVTAVLNALIAIPIAVLFGAIERRFGPGERVDY
jgi:cell shape-determining protein MreD